MTVLKVSFVTLNPLLLKGLLKKVTVISSKRYNETEGTIKKHAPVLLFFSEAKSVTF